MIAFKEFPKISRLNREIVVTEKIDGTNAAVVIEQAALYGGPDTNPYVLARSEDGALLMFAQSRSKFIHPGDDNHGFAAWVQANAANLFQLGPGVHFGEWWGRGINKRYSEHMDGKRFSLFNTARWGDAATRPISCDVVPVLYAGPFSQVAIEDALVRLQMYGSVACPGCRRAEGVVVFHTAANALFKVTCEKDELPKGVAEICAAPHKEGRK